MDTSEAYRAVRGRMLDLAATGDPATPVPACPEWTVRELLAHVTGVAADVVAGNLGAAGTQPWVEAQLAVRADASVEDLAAEWSDSGPQVDEICAVLGDAIAQLVFDTVSHEQDLRGALGEPGGRDGALDIALGWVSTAWAGQEAGPGALRLRADATDVTLGEGDVAATVTASPFEALRVLTGRRSLDQVRALRWDGDPEPWLPYFTWGPFRPADGPVTEP
jgi:uncharacterized protein (TIGR03083 family)